MHKSIACLAAVASLVSSSAFAQDAFPMYGEITAVRVSVKDTSSDNIGTLQPRTFRLTLGQVVSPSMAVEEFAYVSSSSPSMDTTINGIATNVSKKQNHLLTVQITIITIKKQLQQY
jgi:hypothetical protein